MLYRYKKSLEKIAMGLLSFMPEEKDLKVLQQTIRTYDCEDAWQLYLWKHEEDYIGLIGIEKKEEQWIVRHITVDPSHRGEGIGRKMLETLSKEADCEKLIPCQLVEPFYENVASKVEKENVKI
ncbi:GNAT family N-acetyltransferase [Kurthia senegalensis]|uniref:GNAT family N-acetyltransferase n=1 Tax=Kurthia senegalensis TaxID=1033740 RepID=UPI0002883DE9|nr:GNAT family N-acetyltransferase [Kurthia senegalensis]